MTPELKNTGRLDTDKSDAARVAALRRMSDEFLADIGMASLDRARRDFAFEAGYIALISALTADEVAGIKEDHPSVWLIGEAVARLNDRVNTQDSEFGVRTAKERYSSKVTSRQDADAAHFWAKRMRAAVGWE